MTLLTRHLDAGWYERTQGPKHAAEKWYAQPGATGTVLREEADTPEELAERLDLRERQLSNDQAIVIWPQGARVTDAEHSAAQILGTAPTPVDYPARAVVTSDGDGMVVLPITAIASNLAGSHNAEAAQDHPAQSAADAPLSDEERARLRSEEDALEAATLADDNPQLPPVEIDDGFPI